jgi:hypothetical protein
MRNMRNPWNILVGKQEKKRPLGRIRCIWENNIYGNRVSMYVLDSFGSEYG